MRKYFLSFVALAAGLFATSCQESIVEPQIAGPTTFTVQLPNQMGTKAIGGAENVDQLYVAVYNEAETGATAIFKTKEDVVNGVAKVTLNLIQDQKYDIVFWAQKGESYVDENSELLSIPMKNTFHNSEEGAAFFHFEDEFTPGDPSDIILRRPFAQLNLGTTPESLKTDVQSDSLKLSKSYIKVEKVATTFNTVLGVGEGEQTIEFALANVPSQKLYVGGVKYYYVSMDYLPIAGDDQALVNVNAKITLDNDQVIDHTFTSVPVRENYRTNIVGNLISSTTDFNITIEEGFVEDESDTDDIVSNEYLVVDNVAAANTELSNGADHIAINMIESVTSVLNLNNSSKETLYIQLPDADATLTVQGTNVKELYLSVPDTNPDNDGLTLSINTPNAHVVLTGQVYDVPFSSTSSSTLVLDGVKIKKSVTVEQGNVVVGEGTEIGGNDDGSQIISDEAIVIINGTENEIIVEGDDVVVVEGTQDEINVSNVSELRAAVNTIDAGGVINITENIDGVSDVILINKNITINGADKSISGTASRIFRICSSDLKVEMNDLNIISNAERIGENDIRGISIDSKPVEQVSLTLNNCSVDFTHESACDWTYAVNIVGNETDETKHKITISGGSYEGANVINIRGVGHNITVKNAKLTSLYPYNELFYGSCIYLVQEGNSDLLVEGNTFNGNHAVAINTRTGNNVSEKDNTDNTKRAIVKAGDEYCYSLEEAIGSIESEGVIKLLSSIESDPVTIPNGKTITLNLNGKTITAVDNSTGSYGLITNNANLTIKGPGTISISATNNRGWNAYSSVISNQPGGNLTVGEGVVIKHLGGTDMAYGIDNLTNGKGTSAITTINDATVRSTYRAVRQFLNGVEANNSLTVNSGAVIEGANKSIWMQDPSTKPNTGTLVVNEEATLNGDVYLYVCAGSTEWPVSVSIAASTVKGEVLTGNVPAGYEVVEVDGVWTVRREVSDKSELSSALAVGGLVVLGADIEVTEDLNIENVQVILDLNGKTITATKSNAIVAKNGAKVTLKNGNISAYEAVVRAIGAEVIIESGNYTQTGTAVGDPATYRYAIDSREGGKITIDGGEFTSGNGMINVGSAVEINGGKFTNIVEKTMTRHFAYVSSDLTINGGEFYGKANPSAGGCFFCGAAGGCDIQINGGKFTSLWTSGSVNRIFEVYYGGIINVTGGLFNTNGGIATFVTENTDEATKADYPYVAK